MWTWIETLQPAKSKPDRVLLLGGVLRRVVRADDRAMSLGAAAFICSDAELSALGLRCLFPGLPSRAKRLELGRDVKGEAAFDVLPGVLLSL